MSIENGERIAVRAIIIVDHNKVLLGKRGRGVGEAQYALVGGKPDGDENLELAIRRETFEETGLRLQNLDFWKHKFDDKSLPGQKWWTYYFIGQAR